MKRVYKCEIDGKVFDLERDCLKHEFELKGGSSNFKNMVNETLKYLESTSDLTFELIEAKAEVSWDGDPNTDVHKYVEWQEIELKVYHNDEQRGETYSRGAQGSYTREVIIDEITKEYIIPYQKVHEGYLTDDVLDYYGSGYNLNGVDLDSILRAMYGKKIRLEVIE